MRNQIVILAGGKGTRMGNPNIPKILVMLNNKPLILYALEEIEKIGQLAKPIIVVGFGASKVQGVLGSHYIYAHQDKQLGTAHALLAAKPKIRAENILVIYGDMPFIKGESLSELIKSHFKTGSKFSMLSAEVENFDSCFASLKHYGRIIRDPGHNIIGIVEFKDATETQRKIKEINPGIYMFNTKWLWEHINKIQNKNAQSEFYLTDIVDVALAHGEKVNSFLVDAKEVIGINSKEDFTIAERLLK